MVTDPLVSIILTSYNQPELLEIAFQSLIGQTYKNIEIIIVDDCSQNFRNRKQILKYYQDFPGIVRYILHTKNMGIAKNKNSGFQIAEGDFITFLDGDDYYFPEKIATELGLFQQDAGLDIVYSNFVFAKSSGELAKQWGSSKMPEGFILSEIVKEEFPDMILYRFELARRHIYERCNFYDEEIKIYHDWDFRIRYAANSKVGYSPKVLSVYRRTEESITIKSSLSTMVDEKMLVIKKNKSLIDSYPGLKGFYKHFKKQALIEKLFDTRLAVTDHYRLCFMVLLHNPIRSLTVLKSTRYYHLNRTTSTR